MSLNRHYKNEKPLEKGKTRFVIEYEGFGITFKTDVDAVDEIAAKAYFEKFYPSARFVSIRKKIQS